MSGLVKNQFENTLFDGIAHNSMTRSSSALYSIGHSTTELEFRFFGRGKNFADHGRNSSTEWTHLHVLNNVTI